MMNESSALQVCEIFNRTDEGMTTFEQFFYIGCGITGCIFNATVMVIALLHVDTHDKPRQIIVINMTAADLLMCLVYMLTRPVLLHLPILLCYPYYVIICAVQLCSCFNLLWSARSRSAWEFVIGISVLTIPWTYTKKRSPLLKLFPLRYYMIVNRFRIIIVAVLTWSTIVCLAMFGYHFMSYFSSPPRCDQVALPPFIYTPLCIMYVSVIIGCFTISVIIFLIAQNSNRIEGKARSNLFQRLFFLFSSTLWTFFTCLPYRLLYLANIIESHLPAYYCPSLAMMTATDFFFRILVLGTVINPLITVLTQRIYRERLLWCMARIRAMLRMSKDVDNSNHKFSVFVSRSRRATSRKGSRLESLRLTDKIVVDL